MAWRATPKSADNVEAKNYIIEHKPKWVIGAPPCGPFSILNVGMNYPKMKPEDVEAKLRYGRRHLHFMISLYQVQLAAGRHFLHEQPSSALSWKDPVMLKLLSHFHVMTNVSDQCEYGATSLNSQGE